MPVARPNFGIGVDIESIGRFRKAGQRFLERVYTDKERRYCNLKKNPAESLAARFAAKEAVMKAMHSLGIGTRLGYADIEVAEGTLHAPAIHIKKRGFDNLIIRISLSHSKDNAIASALVILER